LIYSSPRCIVLVYIAEKEYIVSSPPSDLSIDNVKEIIKDITFLSSMRSILDQLIGRDEIITHYLRKYMGLWLSSLTPLPYMYEVITEIRDIINQKGLTIDTIIDKLGEKYLEHLLTKIYTYRLLYRELPNLPQQLSYLLLSVMTKDLVSELLRLLKAMETSLRRMPTVRKVVKYSIQFKSPIEVISILAILITLLSDI